MPAYAVRRDQWAERLDKFPALNLWNWHGGKVVFRCPTCKGVMNLGNHGIADDGVVSPSVQCPHCHLFDENVILEMYGDAPQS